MTREEELELLIEVEANQILLKAIILELNPRIPRKIRNYASSGMMKRITELKDLNDNNNKG